MVRNPDRRSETWSLSLVVVIKLILKNEQRNIFAQVRKETPSHQQIIKIIVVMINHESRESLASLWHSFGAGKRRGKSLILQYKTILNRCTAA